MKQATKSKSAQKLFLKNTEQQRNQAILAIADILETNLDKIITENEIDIQSAHDNNLSTAIIDRLKLDKSRVEGIIASVRAIADQEQVVNQKQLFLERNDGLKIYKQSIPLGVIGMIFESRPNVVVDGAALAIKSGNCIILKGGSDAKRSNHFLSELIRKAIKDYIPEDVVQLINSRDEVNEMLSQVGLIDVIIPRGGERLINFVYEKSQIPVIAHFKGLCHLYIDEGADQEKALDIILNAKTQRTGVCNAIETLLIHESLLGEFSQNVLSALKDKGTELRIGDKLAQQNSELPIASEEDWSTEYLDNILSIKVVASCDEAIEHIQRYGSQHTEAIVSQNQENIDKFINQIDASSVMVNASTRFNDGGEFGLGAEIGISTTKLHAYGPMGAKELTTYRYLVIGDGHIRK